MTEIDALLALSARIGGHPSLVQGPGGNTSIKSPDGAMLIKASGTWLAQALDKPIMVPVALDPLLEAIGRDDPATETSQDFVIADRNPGGLRPSIETTLHAVMPQRVVVHVHCVETIAWAARRDAKAAVARRLAGLDWAFAPYARPGRPLTRSVRDNLRDGVSVVVLGNHGLVVAADSVAGAETLLAEAVSRLRLPVRPEPAADMMALEAAAAGSRYRPASDPAIHALATDARRFAVATSGSFYPDHVIFLGPAAVPLAPGIPADAMAAHVGRPALPMLLVEGKGVLLHERATPGAVALARCLADVTGRIEPGTPLRLFTEAEEDALTNWDAEKYRQSLDRKVS